MKLRIAVSVLLLAVVALLLNELAVTREKHKAEPFAGGHVLELDGPDLNVREYGPAGDRAVVLLHGYSASIEWWEQVAPRLARDQRVIAIDLVGHGGSEAPNDGAPYRAAEQAKAVHTALVQLGVRHAALIGHSMGGAVSAELARQYPDLVERVVVSDTPAADDLVTMPLLGKMLCWPVIGPALDRFRTVDAITESCCRPDSARTTRCRTTRTARWSASPTPESATPPRVRIRSWKRLPHCTSPCWCCGATRMY
ncbi:alpha/beta fold hydrolase [Mycolicibacterium nivoides]|uniref:alpha/beta fold hydrolase n=1 Tax=Mycolicibacterium nivoides TaxID=2487344 RepID=UPI003C2DACB9